MFTPKKIVSALITTGGLIVYIMALVLPVGFIFAGLQLTGTFTALIGHIVMLTGTSILILLMAGVICYIFGMVGISLMAYIVLAVTAIPALVQSTGMSEIGLHLFVIYYLLTSMITPPVCISVWIASALAKSPVWKTGFTAMRLAIILYFIPFFFVFNSALIFEGPWYETLYLFVFCLIGIVILGGGLEGYLVKLGNMSWWARPLFVVGGFLIAFPNFITTFIGVGLTALAVAIVLVWRKKGTGIAYQQSD
jgi:TRAP-type uncharacterized transport system fused permease subunit